MKPPHPDYMAVMRTGTRIDKDLYRKEQHSACVAWWVFISIVIICLIGGLQ